MNIEKTLDYGRNILKRNDIKNPILDSEILLSQSINKDRKYIIVNSDKNINEKNLDKFNLLIERRKKGEPIAYIVNKKEFWKETFYVDRDVLIPRPDTELIIEEILKIYPDNCQKNVLDIGTGSGCIILSLLKERPKFYGTGIDISKKTIKVAEYNAKILRLTKRIKFYKSDVDNFKIGKYDLIVSNPPYIKLSTLKSLDKDVIGFEPKLALNGGLDGFLQIRKVINNASILIKKKGKLILEIGFNQKNIVQEILKKKGFYINKVLKDYGKNDRCIISTKN